MPETNEITKRAKEGCAREGRVKRELCRREGSNAVSTI